MLAFVAMSNSSVDDSKLIIISNYAECRLFVVVVVVHSHPQNYIIRNTLKMRSNCPSYESKEEEKTTNSNNTNVDNNDDNGTEDG